MASSPARAAADQPAVYKVEKLLDKRRAPGKRRGYEYHVRWEGYGSADNSWEPEEHIDAHEMLAFFQVRARHRDHAPPAAATWRLAQGAARHGASVPDGANASCAPVLPCRRLGRA